MMQSEYVNGVQAQFAAKEKEKGLREKLSINDMPRLLTDPNLVKLIEGYKDN